MCSTLVLGIAGLATMAAGTAVQAKAQQQAQESQNLAAEYNAQINERNATIAKMQAKDVADKGAQTALLQKQQVAKHIASQNAGYAGAGVQVGSGSALAAIQDSAAAGELDSLQIRNQTEQDIWALQNQANSYTAQASMNRATKGSSGLAVGATLLTGASGLMTSYSGMKAQGVFG
jgi:hypothetical protein